MGGVRGRAESESAELQGVPNKCSHVWETINPTKIAPVSKAGLFWDSKEVLILMGTEIFNFWPLGVEKVGFKIGDPISKNGTIFWDTL